VQDGSEACSACGQRFDTGLRGKAGLYRRRTLELDALGIKSGDLIAGRYEVRGPIGNGPLGVVFRVRDREVDVELALKVIAPNLLQSPDERADFLRSLKQARRLAHPNLVRIYDAGQIEATATLPARAFFTSQLLEGMSLRRVIQLRREKGQVFSVHETEPILAQIAQALEHAYRLGPHGDLKPENVMVLPDLLKVMDFGVASAIPRAPFLAAQRQRKADAYIAPEVLGNHPFDQTSDMYALGVILGEMLAGVVPSSGSQPPDLRETQRTIPTVVEAVYRRAANPDPQVRFATPGEFASEMFSLAEGLPTKAPESVPESSKVGVSRAGAKGSGPSPVSASGRLKRSPVPPRLAPSTEIPWADLTSSPKEPAVPSKARPEEEQGEGSAKGASAEVEEDSPKGQGWSRGKGWPMIVVATFVLGVFGLS
jgi:serine/threonine protein kinase